MSSAGAPCTTILQCRFCGSSTSRLCQRCENVVYCGEACERADGHDAVCEPGSATTRGGFSNRGPIVRFQTEKPKEWRHALELLQFILCFGIPRILIVQDNGTSFSKFILPPEQLKSHLSADSYVTLKNMHETRKPGQVCWVLLSRDNSLVMERLRIETEENLAPEFRRAAEEQRAAQKANKQF